MAAPLISVMAWFFSLIMALSILTLNCNGIRDQSKRAGLVQWLRSLPVGADIVCLQETHCLSSAEVRRGFFLLASLLSFPLGLLIRVVVLSFFAPRCLWLIPGVMS